MADVGRPTKLESIFYQKLPQLIQLGCTDSKIAEIFGVAQSTIALWKKSNTEFMINYNLEHEIVNRGVEQSLYQRAIGTKVKETRTMTSDRGDSVTEIIKELPPDTEAAKFWLTNRRPESWRSSPDVLVSQNAFVRIELPNGQSADIALQTARQTSDTVAINGSHTNGNIGTTGREIIAGRPLATEPDSDE